MMRRYMAVILAALMLLAVGCGGDKQQLNWDGNYHNEAGYLAIGDSTNKKFSFAFLMNDGKELRGIADVKGSEAEYGDIMFSLSGDTLVVSLKEGATQAGLSSFIGTYMMNNVGTVVDEGSPQEMGLPAQTTDPAVQPTGEQPVVEQQPEEQPVVEQQPEEQPEEQPVVEQQTETEQPVTDAA